MKRLNDLRIGMRLNLLVGVSFSLSISILGFYIYFSQRTNVIKEVDLRISEQVNDLSNLVQQQIRERQVQIKNSMNAGYIIERHCNHRL